MATLRPRVAQAREGKAQARRSQGLFASASRRSSKTSLESGGGQTTSSRATPVTLTPVRTPAASPRRNWTSSPQRVRVTSRAHPAFCPLGQAGPGPGRGHSTSALSALRCVQEKPSYHGSLELQRLGRRCSLMSSFWMCS